jgi:hypothetical protein
MLVAPIPEREFNLYALALPQGPNFEPYVVVSGWKCDNARSIDAVLLNHGTGDFGIRVFRRRIDHCFVTVASKFGFVSQDAALVELTAAMSPGAPEEAIPPGVRKRRPLLLATAKNANDRFKLLTGWSRDVARWIRCGLSVAGPFVCRCLTSRTRLRFHIPLIAPDVRICRIRLSEKTHTIAVAIACDAVCNF